MRKGFTCEELRVQKLIDKIRKIYLKAYETLKKKHKKEKERHDQHMVEKTFKVEDRVWFHLNKE